MLCRRYGGNAFSLLDSFISAGRLCKFLDSFFDMCNESELWEFWLHKETGKTWSDFRLFALPQDVDTQKLSDTIDSVMNILAGGG